MANLYATTTSIDTLMIGTTFDTATTSLANQCIAWAQNEVNKYLSKRYDLSVYQTTTAYATLPPLMQSWTEMITTGYMYTNMSRGSKEGLARGAAITKVAVDNLKAISEYKMDLIGKDGNIVDDKTNASMRVLSNTTDYSNTFNEDDPKSWSIDSDKLTDIDSERD